MSLVEMKRPVDILLVEDNAGDVRLTVEAFKSIQFPHVLHTAKDGVEALSFLRRNATDFSAPRPDLILLDLNLPRKDGREVLAEIKTDPVLKHIPVVVLSTSGSEEDILRSYHLQANCYIQKPIVLSEFFLVIRRLVEFWFGCVHLPSKPE